MSRSFHARHARTIMTVLVLLAPLVGWGANEAFERANNNIKLWLPKDFDETEDYDEFCRRFGSDDFALISWDGCTLDDPRLGKLAAALVPPPDAPHRHDGCERFEAVITGPEALDTLVAEPFSLPRSEAMKRLEGALIGPDHRSTCALVTYSELGNRKRPDTLVVLQEIAESACGIEPDELRVGGATIYNTAIDIESEKALNTWIALSGLVALLVTWRCLRSGRLTAMVLFVAIYAAALGTSAIYYTGGTMNLVLVVQPVLIYVLTLSASVHLSNYYRDAVRESGPDGAPRTALAHGWAPCTLSAATTALGLGSLYVSHILPVKMFGLYSAIGVLLSLGVLFLALPAAMETWPLARTAAGDGAKRSDKRAARLISQIVHFVMRRRRVVVTLCLVCLLFLGSGVALIRTSLRPLRLLSPQSRWIIDAVWFEQNLGSLLPIEVELVFDDEAPLNFLERMELVDQVAKSTEALSFVGGTMSAATFGLPPDKAAASDGPQLKRGSLGRTLGKIAGIRDREALRRQVLNTRLTRNRDEFVKHGFLSVDGDCEVWRLSVRVEALNDMEYDEVLTAIEERVDFVLVPKKLDAQAVRPIYTGLLPLAQVGQEELLNGLVKSFCLALAMIAVAMVLLLRSFRAGLLAMLPNVFPTLITFGTMGWAATYVDIGAMMTASVALGIAVDDTLHFLAWFRRATGAGKSRHEAIEFSFRRCAPAMTQTTLIAGLGLLVFFLSSFQPISQFGLLMCILLVSALVGDLIFLPALLATRLGNYFARTSDSSEERTRNGAG